MKTYLIPAIVIFILSACQHKDGGNPAKEYLVLSAPKAVRFAPPKQKADIETDDKTVAKVTSVKESLPENDIIKDTSKKIIKQGDIRFEAKNIMATRKALLYMLNKLGGYADEDNESVSSDSDSKEYNIKARIPAKNFDTFLDSVSSGAVKVDFRHISISDVTSQYIDMTTRLHNQKILEATYIGLLKRSSKMSDVLEVEDKLTDTRTEIESEQGQLNYMSKQIAYSSLDITFYTKQVQHDTGNTISYRLTSAFSDGWRILQAVFFGVITLWPLVLLSIGIFILIRILRKKRHIKAEQ
jgi:hypothetical protein